ncbi:GNAT family N-acetyltransferase [Peribacillus sp. NPDC097675]|uniref:GNAT family N-acetyltransferase n=1 Tax=Peribacillus sp. NPDC097675 TaxID=3390618 RepID=UPI003D02DFB1
MNIRKATVEDAEKAAILIRLAIKEIAEALTGETKEDRILAALGDLFRSSGNRMSFENTMVCEHDGQMAGLIIAYHGKDAEALDEPIAERLRRKMKDSSIKIDKEAEIEDFYLDTICVDSQYRGKGIGTSLIHHMEDLAMERGYHRISLIVEDVNPDAGRLYVRLGYKKTKMITVSGGEFAYMVKELKKTSV